MSATEFEERTKSVQAVLHSGTYAHPQLRELDVRDFQDVLAEAIVRSDLPPRKAARMVTIREGVMEVWGERSHRFEAALETDEGPKTLSGNVVKSRSSVDVQSGPLEGWQPAIKQADEAIRFAYDNQEPHEALKTISRIWEHLDRVSELAAARSRLLMGKVDKPRLAEVPKWFEQQEPALRQEEEGQLGATPLAVEDAQMLVRAVLASVEETGNLEAQVETGPLGRVTINWHIPGLRLEWMVEATDLPWPSVKVYQVFRPTDAGDPKPAETQIFHNAFDVVESFAQLLRAE